MFRKPLAAGLLILTAIVCTTCTTVDAPPDPEPMPGYANPWIGSAGSNTPPQPAPKTPPTKTPPPPPPPQQAAVPAPPPASRAPLLMQPSASAPMQVR